MTRRLTSVILTFLLLASVPAFGQGTRGSLRGLVADPNGAAINGATVTLKQVGTNEEFKATTDSQGAFVFPSLPPGKYSATVEASGFKRTELTEVIIEVNQQAKVDISLEVGAVTEQVTVTGTAQEVINTTSPTLSKTINAKQVNDLPLLSRNPIDLARLQAGIAVTGTDIRNASVGGLRGTATNITQDLCPHRPIPQLDQRVQHHRRDNRLGCGARRCASQLRHSVGNQLSTRERVLPAP